MPGVPRSNRDVVREGWAYDITRWPLLSLIFFLIGLEFAAYVLTRQLVNLVEWSVYCAFQLLGDVLWSSNKTARTGWGKKGRLRAALQTAPTYEAWKEAALNMDDRQCNFSAVGAADAML